MKIALVTGGGTGVGRAAAVALAKAGWRVALTGRRAEALEATSALLPEGRGWIRPCDVTQEGEVARLFEGIEETFGRLDLLFNNAGAGAAPKPIDRLSLEEFKRAVDVNLVGLFLCTRAAVALMKRQTPRGGRIINNGSISAHAPRLYSAPYTATKHAVTGMTKAVALEGRSFDIACGQIDIGNARTEMTASIAEGALQANGGREPEALMDVEEVGRAVAHMASLPLNANVLFMTLMATAMPFVGRG